MAKKIGGKNGNSVSVWVEAKHAWCSVARFARRCQRCFRGAYPQRIAAATKLSIRLHLAWMTKCGWEKEIFSVTG